MTDTDIHKVRAAVRQWAGAHERPGPKNHDMIDLIEVLLATGIRIGEALALRWSDLALDDPTPTLTISGQVDYEPGRGAFRKATKTKHSNRVFVLPHFAATALSTRKMLMPPNDLDAVFVTRNGTWHQESNMQKRLRRIRHEAGLDWVKFHTFRRTVGTEVGNTIDSDAAAALLGHGSSAITERHYIEKQRRVVDVSSVLQDRFTQPMKPPVSPADRRRLSTNTRGTDQRRDHPRRQSPASRLRELVSREVVTELMSTGARAGCFETGTQSP